MENRNDAEVTLKYLGAGPRIVWKQDELLGHKMDVWNH